MTQFEAGVRPLPTIAIDAHFANVPRLEEVRFDPERCATLFTHPAIGIAERDLSRIRIYLRPDYQLAYTREERRALREAHPDDYTDAASCDWVPRGSPLGRAGDVLMTIVYGAGFSPNALLCHEGVHARKKLDLTLTAALGQYAMRRLFPKTSGYANEHLDAEEETAADRAMKNATLRSLRKGVITVVRSKKRKR